MKLRITTTRYTPSIPNELKRYSFERNLLLVVPRMMCYRVSRSLEVDLVTYRFFYQKKVDKLDVLTVKDVSLCKGLTIYAISNTHT